MLTVDITKKLNKKHKEVTTSSSLNEAKLLLAGTEQEERTLLKEAGLDGNFKQIEKEVGINLEREKFETNLKSKFFTLEEIKEFCMNYKLRFLPSNRFKGTIDPTTGAKLVRFFKERNIDGASHEASSNLFIMAPEKAFNLDEVKRPIKNDDPVLFYRVRSAEGDMYAIIHKWGNDFSITRRLLGIIYKNMYNLMFSRAVFNFIVINSIFAISMCNPLHWLPLVISTVLAFVIAFSCTGLEYGDEESNNRLSYDERKANSKFTKYNWNSPETF